MSGRWLDPGLGEVPEPAEVQVELAEWVEVRPKRWKRRMREWEGDGLRKRVGESLRR